MPDNYDDDEPVPDEDDDEEEDDDDLPIGDPPADHDVRLEPPPLKSSRAIADLERRGKPTQVLRQKVDKDYRSPWEGRPREGFTAAQEVRAVQVLSHEKAGQSKAGKVPGATDWGGRA